ncbi:Thermolysin metallopeptidase, catalytic domain [Modicisalibacter ilicicola DSM 19980]|uniref:Neutral metalloproteinase n=1 Tax=Modicisalibacter ilicicola DSM 19980 TaxID=1121942 RepID=A0A1M4SDM7_9GAMM|nr:M4 family metallopeptidase [Halomonas ilicicola]SHE30265.1 Thermolysin metallopeptidase, catalytic domain [Halomonas ilicicola DSM 19980]
MHKPTPRTRPGFMPPFILERIAAHGDARLKGCAQRTLEADAYFRTRRDPQIAANLALPEGSPRPGEPARYIYSADYREVLPGTLVREEGQGDTGDPAADEAYSGLGVTYRFFWEVFERNSIDDRGMPLLGTVHYGQDYENAFWNGAQMVFGDGDGELFNRFTAALDVIGHELAHGVIEREAGLVYTYQSGALNESFADVFGSLTKQYHLGQTAAEADWLIGAELLTERVQGRALRSMAEPGTAYDDPILGRDPQPGHMDDYVETEQDNGGVHINSGIPNHAFYLAAMALGGHAWDAAGLVWYDTLRDPRLAEQSDFATFAALVIDNAGRRFGNESREAAAVRDAWQAVGVTT